MRISIFLLFCIFFQDLHAVINEQTNLPMPENSKLIEENRFQSSKSYLDTKKFFYYAFLNNSQINISRQELNLPQVRVTTYKINNPCSLFLYINIYYETAKNITTIYFVPKPNLTEKVVDPKIYH